MMMSIVKNTLPTLGTQSFKKRTPKKWEFFPNREGRGGDQPIPTSEDFPSH